MGFNADLVLEVNAACASVCGDSGAYLPLHGSRIEPVDIVLDLVSGLLTDELGPVESRPVALVREDQVPNPQPGERLELLGKTYTIDTQSRDNGMWTLTLLPL
jgi:hypothetical protein